MAIRKRWLSALVLLGAFHCNGDDEVAGARHDEHGDDVDARAPAPSLEGGPDLSQGAPPAKGTPPVPLGTCVGPAGRTLRTLIVGNSQIYYWDLPKLLSDLSRSAAPECPRIEAEGFTRGGQNLKRLWEGGDSLGRKLVPTLRSRSYDVVVITESIDLLELPPPHAQFVEYATIMIQAARAAGARPILYATPYPDQEEHFGFVEMANPQLALGRARGVTVAAGGLAWLRVWKVLPEVDLHHTDHSHPGLKGSVISAMVLHAAITRASPRGLRPSTELQCYREVCMALTASEVDVFQGAAWAEAQATSLE